jgi:hypothetical protein
MDLVALLGAGASAIALLMTTLRKRQDLDVSELKTRATEQATRLDEAEKEVSALRAALIQCEEVVFKLRRILAKHGIREADE